MKYLLILLLCGCGRYPELTQPGDGWDDHLAPIVYEFAEDVEAYGLPPGHLGILKVLREDTQALLRVSGGETLLGVCLRSGYDKRRMRAEIYIVEGLGEDELRSTMYHELTHCAYGVGHWGAEGDIQYPSAHANRMSWQEQKDRHFKALKDHLIHGRDPIPLIP